MGTRHRAALGMSLRADAVVVVVSERPASLLAENGVLIRPDRQNLFNLLVGDMVPPADEEKKRPFWRRKHEKQHE
ncbi:MAG: diadenylate cyclase [Ruthenibacterium lactatiformans]